MKIGILGGTFNPPHAGHIIIAEDISNALKLDKVFFIPTNLSPHKENDNIGGQIRLDMVRLAISGNPSFEALSLEIERGGVSFTIDTVRELKRRYPEDEFYLIVGSDLANQFSSWKDYRDIEKEVKIVVANRREYPLDKKNLYSKVEIRQIKLSSSQIRELVRSGSSLKGLVEESVADYIEKHSLYKLKRRNERR